MKTTTSKNQIAREHKMAITFAQAQDLMQQLQEKIDNTESPETCTWGQVEELMYIRSKLAELVSM